MDRRSFLRRLTAAGLVAASPRLIFDLNPTNRRIELESVEDFRPLPHQFDVRCSIESRLINHMARALNMAALAALAHAEGIR